MSGEHEHEEFSYLLSLIDNLDGRMKEEVFDIYAKLETLNAKIDELTSQSSKAELRPVQFGLSTGSHWLSRPSEARKHADLVRLKDTGFDYVRMKFSSMPNFDIAKEAGVKINAVQPNPIDSGEWFKNMSSRADKIRSVDRFQLWNEPNVRLMWNRGSGKYPFDPDLWAKKTCDGVRILRGLGFEGVIVTSGLAPWVSTVHTKLGDFGMGADLFLDALFREMRDDPGIEEDKKIEIGVHPYVGSDFWEWRNPGSRHPKDAIPSIWKYLSPRLEAEGRRWAITEVGWTIGGASPGRTLGSHDHKVDRWKKFFSAYVDLHSEMPHLWSDVCIGYSVANDRDDNAMSSTHHGFGLISDNSGNELPRLSEIKEAIANANNTGN